MKIGSSFLEESFEDFWKRLGVVPIPQDLLQEHIDHVEQVVIPEIVQAVQNRIPTQEEVRKIFY